MNAERGFRRLALVSSLALFLVATLANAFVNDMPYWYGLFWRRVKDFEFPSLAEWLAVGFPFMVAAIPWALFYALFWVVRGFRG
jgi:hypothetical protein